MTLMNYRFDPVFKRIGQTDNQYRQRAKACNIECQIIDILTVEDFETKILNKNKVVVTNTVFTDNLDRSSNLELLPHSFYGIYHHPYSIDDVVPQKNYNCLINRIDPIRQSWFYLLIKQQMLGHGFVSFNVDTSRSPDHGVLTPLEIFEQNFQLFMPNFAEQHQVAKSIVPYRNFHDTTNLEHIIMLSKFSIVLETYFDDNRSITFSEKIFRCLQLPRPWLLFGPKHAVNYIRSMGFDVLDDLVNHDHYDNNDSSIVRQSCIMNLATELSMIDITQYQKRLAAAAKHNQTVLERFSQSADQDFASSLNNAKTKLSKINGSV